MPDLQHWLGEMYRTSVVSRGEGHELVRSAFRSALALDPALRAEAEALRTKLLPVDKVRGGRDFITRKQLEFLDSALKEDA